MANVYSDHFIVQDLVSPALVNYVVPAGFKAVVRDISAVLEAVFGEAGSLQCSAGLVIFAKWDAAPQQRRTIHWDGRVVLNAGEQLQARADGSGFDAQVIVSGYLLTLP